MLREFFNKEKRMGKKKINRRVSSPYTLGALAFTNLGYVKQLCDNYGVQINLTFRPEQIQIRISKIDQNTGILSKSEKHIFKNEEIGTKITSSTLEIIIRNLLANWYPSSVLST
jgi:phosphate starvation-inducible protein PhoH